MWLLDDAFSTPPSSAVEKELIPASEILAKKKKKLFWWDENDATFKAILTVLDGLICLKLKLKSLQDLKSGQQPLVLLHEQTGTEEPCSARRIFLDGADGFPP